MTIPPAYLEAVVDAIPERDCKARPLTEAEQREILGRWRAGFTPHEVAAVLRGERIRLRPWEISSEQAG